jgi:hypothetical protein
MSMLPRDDERRTEFEAAAAAKQEADHAVEQARPRQPPATASEARDALRAAVERLKILATSPLAGSSKSAWPTSASSILRASLSQSAAGRGLRSPSAPARATIRLGVSKDCLGFRWRRASRPARKLD